MSTYDSQVFLLIPHESFIVITDGVNTLHSEKEIDYVYVSPCIPEVTEMLSCSLLTSSPPSGEERITGVGL